MASFRQSYGKAGAEVYDYSKNSQSVKGKDSLSDTSNPRFHICLIKLPALVYIILTKSRELVIQTLVEENVPVALPAHRHLQTWQAGKDTDLCSNMLYN